MSANTQTDHKPDLTAAVVKRFIQVGMMVVIQAVTLFFSAGRLNWVEGWAYLGLYIAFIAANAVVMLPHNKELIAERSEIRENAKGWDRVVGGGTVLLGPVMLIVSGLDERFGWSPPLMPAIQWAAMVLIALGYGVFGWAMATNKFFSAVVRIQKDRGHTVVTNGPYQCVRHPGYVGMIISTLATPVMLGSRWALIPALVMMGGMILRTALEDNTLQNELDGYKEYARRVRYRLVPGVW